VRLAVAAAAALLAACATAPAPQGLELVAPGLVSTRASEWNAHLAPDGALVFARSPDADFQDARIMLAPRDGSGWSTPQPIGFSADGYIDTDPQLTPDGRGLLFVSNRPATGAGPAQPTLDLWRARREGSGWSTPESLTALNSPGQELGPEIHGGAVYFNSTRRGGPGALDVWTARIDGEGFAAPTPLPAPLNSPASEGDFTLSPDGRVALFWSDRPGGLGEGDIYLSRRDGAGWSAPVNLGAPVNSAGFDFTPSFSRDGRWLYFASMRPRDGGDFRSDVYRIRIDAVGPLAAALRR
jgi:hypothetical protein